MKDIEPPKQLKMPCLTKTVEKIIIEREERRKFVENIIREREERKKRRVSL